MNPPATTRGVVERECIIARVANLQAETRDGQSGVQWDQVEEVGVAITRQDLEACEAATLAPYAVLSAESGGRWYSDAEPAYRTAFQRDRDRILHSAAFRRLEYKTQVFMSEDGDY